MGHAGNTRVQWFAASAVMARIEEVYAGLIAGRPPPA
jgi:hypothetical protein